MRSLKASLSGGSRKAGCKSKSVFGAFEWRVRSGDKKLAFTRVLCRFPLTLRYLVNVTFSKRSTSAQLFTPGRGEGAAVLASHALRHPPCGQGLQPAEPRGWLGLPFTSSSGLFSCFFGW